MNHFLALMVDAATRDRLAAVAERLRSWQLPARWVHPEDYHLTLAFLGHLDEAEAAAVAWSVEDVAAQPLPTGHSLVGLGAFAGRLVPRVVYAAVDDSAGAGADLAHDLADALGEDPDARHLHLTLCRPAGRPADTSRTWPELLAAHGQAHWGPCDFESLALCRSEPAPPDRPRYRRLASWPA